MKKCMKMLLLCCIAGAGCGTKKDGKILERHTIDKVNLRDVMAQTGEVQPIIKAELKSEASGKIEKIHIKEGEKVWKGDTILVIDPLRLLYKKEKTELAVDRAGIRKEKALRDYEQAKELFTTGTVPEKELADLKNEYELAEIAYKQEMLELKDILDQLDKTVVSAPMDGVITALNVEEGEIVVSATTGFQSGTSIGTIADITKLEVVSQIGEVDYIHLEKGQKVMIKPEAFENASTKGTITFISLSARRGGNDELGNFEVRISVDSIIPGIAPGINVNVEFVLTEKKNVLGVPNHFVTRQRDRYFVRTLAENNRNGGGNITRTEIEVGSTDFRHYEILSGLSRGDVVVLFKDDGEDGKPRKQRRK
ncbi:MAG: efflux RND transporter periplasmic adaptor subunit [Chitinivibrionales bacterium]|nr:efflux RND transporter periplasmic adaptor subunit [Chitinivibrionales bacterium]